MKKILCTLILGTALVGCGGTEPQEAQQYTAPDGRTLNISISDEADFSQSAGDADSRVVSEQACWVKLLYCAEPGSGQPSCQGSAGCTIQQTITICGSLIGSTC